jgi:hypothetical protein
MVTLLSVVVMSQRLLKLHGAAKNARTRERLLHVR